MSDVQYSVEVNFLQSGGFSAPAAGLKTLHGKVKDLHKDFSGIGMSAVKGLDSAMSTVGDTIAKAAGGIAAASAAALGLGVGHAVKQGFALNEFKEDLTTGIAGTLSMIGDVPIDKGLQQAKVAAEDLRKLAARLPGTFQEAANTFGYILPTLKGHGIEMSRITQMAAMGNAVATSLGISASVTGHETASLLEGRATGRMPLFAKLMGAEMSAKEFNALPFERRLALLEGKYNKLTPMLDRSANTFSGLKNALTDNAKNVMATFTAPLFDHMKHQLQRVSKWAAGNDKLIHAYADGLGRRVGYAFDAGIQAIQRWYGPVSTFVGTIDRGLHRAFAAVQPYLAGFERAATRFMQDPKAFDKIAHVAALLVGLKAGTGAMSLGASGLGGLAKLAPLIEGVAGSAGGIAMLGPVALAGAAAVAALGYGAYGAVEVLADGSSVFHDAAVVAAAGITENTGKTAQSLGRLETALQPVTNLVGTAFLLFLDGAAAQLAFFTDWLAQAAEGIRKVGDVFETFARRFGYLDDGTPAPGSTIKNHLDKEVPDWFSEREGKKKREVPKSVTHVHKVEIHVNSNQDPNRIAKKTVDIITDLVRHPKVTTLAGTPQFNRT